MKVLLVHKYFKYNGGADVFFFETGKVLKEHGHEVAYFSTQDNENLLSEYSRYFVIPPNFNTGNVFQKIKAFSKIPYNFQAKKDFLKLVIDFKPDIVHVFNIVTQISPSILDVAKKRNIPIVISCNDYKHICPNYKLFHHGKVCEDCKGGKFYNCVLNKCSHDSTLFSIASAVESYIHHFLNIYRKNISLFLFASDFMAIKTEEFWGKNFNWAKLLNPFSIPEVPSSYDGGEYGLYFGRLIDEKGVDILIEALKICKKIPFKIVGDGPELDKLKKISKDFELNNIEFTGPIWGKELDSIIEKSQFVVVPSIWHENFPYVILQSFAKGKPVIATRRGGIPELVKDQERGFLYEANNYTELAAKISNLFADKNLSIKMGKNARSYIEENFTYEIFYNQIISNYNSVLI